MAKRQHFIWPGGPWLWLALAVAVAERISNERIINNIQVRSTEYYFSRHGAPTSRITSENLLGSCANLPRNRPSTPSFIASKVPGPADPPYKNLTGLIPQSFRNSFTTATTYSADADSSGCGRGGGGCSLRTGFADS